MVTAYFGQDIASTVPPGTASAPWPWPT